MGLSLYAGMFSRPENSREREPQAWIDRILAELTPKLSGSDRLAFKSRTIPDSKNQC
jgi:hypothetical protein